MEEITIHKYEVRELSKHLEEHHWNTLLDHLKRSADIHAEKAVLFLTEDQHMALQNHVQRYMNARGEKRTEAFEKLLKLMEEYVRKHTAEYVLD